MALRGHFYDMKILFNYPHTRLTGVNTHTYTMAKKLNELGHITDAYIDTHNSPSDNLLSKIKLLGNVFISDVVPSKDEFKLHGVNGNTSKMNIPDVDSYDLVVIVYFWTAEKFADFKKPMKIFIGHGLHDNASSPRNPLLVDKWFYVSKFGAQYLSQKHSLSITYMPQWLDMRRYMAKTPINSTLKSLLVLDSRSAFKFDSKFSEVCKDRSIEHRVLSTKQIPELVWGVEEQINAVDLVIGYGRSAYEGMACDRNVMIYGINGGDGMMTLDTIDKSGDRNCSGWGIRSMKKPEELTYAEIEHQLDQYSIENLKSTRPFVETLDVGRIELFLNKNL